MGDTYGLGRGLISRSLADLPPEHRGPRPRPHVRGRDFGEQPSVVHRLDRDPGGRPATGHFLAKAVYFEGIGCVGVVVARVLRSHRRRRRCSAARARRPSTRSTSSARCSSQAAPSRSTPRARARSTAACTRGERAGVPGAADRCAGCSRRAHRHRRGHAGRRQDAVHAARHGAVRRAPRLAPPWRGRSAGHDDWPR